MRPLIDLTGQRFGRLLVIKRVFNQKKGTYWLCQCDCGNYKEVYGGDLKNGRTKSCGCLRKEILSEKKTIDLSGQKFGKLNVLNKSNVKNNSNRDVYWDCLCECGNKVAINGNHLRRGKSLSCGCLKSKGEFKISKILSENHIKFIKEFSFDNLLSNKGNLLHFDFAILNDNNIVCLIEYQGEHHYDDNSYYPSLKDNDNIKRKFCEENNIKLIEISYRDYHLIDLGYLKNKIALS